MEGYEGYSRPLAEMLNGSNYLQDKKVDQQLTRLLADLEHEKPSDPYAFLAEKFSQLSQNSAPATESLEIKEANMASTKEGKTEGAAKTKEAKKAASKPSKGAGMDVTKADVPAWYSQVMKKAELIEGYPVKGCFTLRPWAYKMWEVVMAWFDAEIKKLGVENGYFPMFIPKEYMEGEKEHLADFAPELAWVTKFGEAENAAEINEPVALRPTSETAIYSAYSGWVQSHRDLPIKVNQWCNMVRWEAKQTMPLIRMRENLWQEGHTAFAEKAAAEEEVLQILELYAKIYEEMLAVPVVRGKKTRAETFPGADYTMTVEIYVGATGRSIQGGTSHHLGQRFSRMRMFEISFQDPKDSTGQAKEYAYQNSWGFSTRSLGAMVLVHGDDRGLVMAPGVASQQVVIVPVGLKASATELEKQRLSEACQLLEKDLNASGVRVKLDDSDRRSSGNKFNYWEMKGVPLRIELGLMDLEKDEFVMAKRNLEPSKSNKIVGKLSSAAEVVQKTLADITKELYSKALADRDACIASIDDWQDVTPNLNHKKLLLIPFCGEPACEEDMKEKTKEEAAEQEDVGGLKMGMKGLCIPQEDKYNINCPNKCINPTCKFNFAAGPQRRVLFGRSY